MLFSDDDSKKSVQGAVERERLKSDLKNWQVRMKRNHGI